MVAPRRISSRQILGRLLEDPRLPERVRSLTPLQLAQWIEEMGLEDAGEIVALATAEQLVGVFDTDLWRSSRPGQDEKFSAARFGIWLEILQEVDPAIAVSRLMALDFDFLVMAFSHLIFVLSWEYLRSEVSQEKRVEKALDSWLSYELEGYLIIARDYDSWDAILAVLTEMDRTNHDFLNQLLDGCEYASNDVIEDNGGLYFVLTRFEQLESDAADARERRREEMGYVSPASARAFLKLAASGLEGEDHVSPKSLRQGAVSVPASGKSEHLKKAVIPKAHLYARVVRFLQSEPGLQELRQRELAYLANVLVEGGEIDGRFPSPAESARTVLEVCEKGLSIHPSARSLIEAFRVGWSDRSD